MDQAYIYWRLSELAALVSACNRKLDIVLQAVQPAPALQASIDAINAETKRLLEAVAVNQPKT